MKALVQRWWAEPSALEVLEGAEGFLARIIPSFARFALLAAVVGPATVMLSEGSGSNASAPELLVFAVFAVIGTLALRRVVRFARWFIYGAGLVMAVFVGLWVGSYDGTAVVIAVVVPTCSAMAAVWYARVWSRLLVTVGAVTYLVTLIVRDVDDVASRWLAPVATAYFLVLELAWVLRGVQDLAEEERAASDEAARLAIAEHEAREELAELNRTLEDRVQQQVREIEGLGRLRRFVPHQVADAALAGSLSAHRRQIAVVFCDLRGFSAFSNTSEPEEILEVLEAYYAVVGVALREYEATAGPFQGDGIIAYFNDPVPCDDPAGKAVAMALSLQEPLDGLCLRWARRGFDLGHAMGIAYGYATLGTVGFEGRTDYTPLGAVVNMALRLRDEADWGEILIDGRTHHAVEGRVLADPCLLELKGFDGQVQAYRLRGAPGL